jgi:hypothetical protein
MFRTLSLAYLRTVLDERAVRTVRTDGKMTWFLSRVTSGYKPWESGADSLPLPQLGLQVHCHAQ